MKVLVVGAGGQVGRALLAAPPPGLDVHGLGRADLDLGDPGRIRETVESLRPDVIVNAAAYTAVDKAESEPEAARIANEEGPRQLARAASAAGARFIHVSTDFVFDGSASTPYKPESACAPLGVYGRTKHGGELAVLDACPDSLVVRTAWVYAATGRNFLLTMLRLMTERGTVRVVADQVGTPTAAASIAEALWRAVRVPAARGLIHWTDAGVASWYDFAQAIAEEGAAAGLLPDPVEVVSITTTEYPTPARRPAYSVLDKGAAVAALGIHPRHWRVNLRNVIGEIANG